MTIWTRLLEEDPTPRGETLEAFWPAHARDVASVEHSIDRALLGGLHADRVGFAFVAGYRAALARLAPTVAHEELAALCATEAGGNHPRAIETTLKDGKLSGHKRWTTLGGRAAVLLVVATTGKDDQGRNRLRVVRVPVSREGVRIVPMDAAPFVPEIPHAEIHLDDVAVADADVLPGDGYDAYLKPFRTVEDLHVHAALLGHIVGVARRSTWPAEAIEEVLALAASVRELSSAPPLDRGTHVALAGLLGAANRTLDRLEPHWAKVDEATRARWNRDRAILGVAGKARDARRASAWSQIVAASERGRA